MMDDMAKMFSMVDDAARQLPRWRIVRDQILWCKRHMPEHPNLPPLLEQLPMLEAEIARMEELTSDWTADNPLAELLHMFYPVEPQQLLFNFWTVPAEVTQKEN